MICNECGGQEGSWAFTDGLYTIYSDVVIVKLMQQVLSHAIREGLKVVEVDVS